MTAAAPCPMSPAEATRAVNRFACQGPSARIYWTEHAMQRCEEREIMARDVLRVLARGVVFDPAEPSQTLGYFRYKIVGSLLSSENEREIAVVFLAPDRSKLELTSIKIITVMWVDAR